MFFSSFHFSPFQVRNDLYREEWYKMFDIEKVYDLNNSYDYSDLTEIPVLHANKLKYAEFFQNFMLPNIPCVIKGVTTNWQSSKLWFKDNNTLNTEYLHRKYGDCTVTVHDCLVRYYNSQKPHDSTFSEYLQYFEKHSHRNSNKLDYLKDWHLKLSHEDDHFYEVPIFFASDWLNEYYLQCTNDDYRFVYMGPKDTWTPFHADVFMSYSWSANLYGKKKWLIFPPGDEEMMRDKLGNLPYDVTEEIQNHDNLHVFTIIQNAGEAIFVPSGWHHQVWNLENTISINHNWVNGCNINKFYDSMKSNLSAIYKQIEDCKEMDAFEEHCQVMLNATFGMDFYKFYDFLKYIGTKRIEMFKDGTKRTIFNGYQIGSNHILFDLQSIAKTLGIFVNSEEASHLEHFVNVDIKPSELLSQISTVLNKNI